jgi:hypothetical protein
MSLADDWRLCVTMYEIGFAVGGRVLEKSIIACQVQMTFLLVYFMLLMWKLATMSIKNQCRVNYIEIFVRNWFQGFCARIMIYVLSKKIVLEPHKFLYNLF